MQHQKGSIAVIVLVGVLVLALLAVGAIISTRNNFVGIEQGIIASNNNRQTILSNVSQKVKEAIGIRELNVKDIQDTVNSQIQMRAGEGGYKAMFLALQEQNIAVDPSVYNKIITIIDVGRTEFVKAEQTLIDRKQVACYTALRFPNNVILGMFGLPSLKIGCNGGEDDYRQLMNEQATESFRTGVDKGLY